MARIAQASRRCPPLAIADPSRSAGREYTASRSACAAQRCMSMNDRSTATDPGEAVRKDEGGSTMKDTGTSGTNAVDWEARVDMDRLRVDRLARLKAELERSELGALLAFDFSNIRYMTATHIGTWAMDKLIRFSLLTRNSRSDLVGLRLGGQAPRALQPVARRHDRRDGRRSRRAARGRAAPAARARRTRGHLHAARRVHARRGHRRGASRARSSASSRSSAWRTSRSASTSSSCPSCSRCSRTASRSSTASRCSWRPVASRPPTRSAC